MLTIGDKLDLLAIVEDRLSSNSSWGIRGPVTKAAMRGIRNRLREEIEAARQQV